MEHPAQGASLIQPFSIAIVQPAYDSFVQNRMTRLCTALKDHIRQLAQIGSGGKKSRIAANSSHGLGIFVVHSTPQKSFRARTPLCKGDSGLDVLGRVVKTVMHLKRRQYPLRDQVIQSALGETLHNPAEQNKPQTGVDDLAASLVL